MPTKSTDMQHKLYFQTEDGRMLPISELTEADLASTDVPYIEMPITWGEMTFTAEVEIHRTLLRYICGFKVPNNWLKMHGHTMRRTNHEYNRKGI